MQHQEVDPPEALRDAIKCFWYTSLDLGEQPSTFTVQPDGYAELIFYFGSPCSLTTDKGVQQLPSPFMMGLLNQPVVFHIENRFEIIGIRYFPWTVFDWLALPSGQDGVRVIEHPIAELQPLLAQHIQAGALDEAFAQVEQYCLQAQVGASNDRTLAKAGAVLRKANGMLPVSGVAAAAHATVRTLERKFKHASGYTVKDVSGLMRFEQVRNHLWHHPDVTLASLAYELGYTDQAHLSREFKRYSGTTPAAFARKVKKGKQIWGTDLITLVRS